MRDRLLQFSQPCTGEEERMRFPVLDKGTRMSGSERLRRLVRSLLPTRIYGVLSDLLDGAFGVSRLGWARYLELRSLLPGRYSQEQRFQTLVMPDLRHPFCVRAGTSDVRELVYVTVRQAYGRYLPHGPVRVIVDAGAGNGDTTVWYLSRFPEAKVIALEPDPESFELLALNCRLYGDRAVLMRAGLWFRETGLKLKPSAMPDGVSVLESHEGRDCEGLSISSLMENCGIHTIDILKCDIEGAELGLFSVDSDKWLPRTRYIVIEVHSAACLSAVLAATGRHGFRHRAYRNLHIFSR